MRGRHYALDAAPPFDQLAPQQAVAPDRLVIDEAARSVRQDDDVVVDRVAEADLRLWTVRGEDKIFRRSCRAPTKRNDPVNRIAGFLGPNVEHIPVSSKNHVEFIDGCRLAGSPSSERVERGFDKAVESISRAGKRADLLEEILHAPVAGI